MKENKYDDDVFFGKYSLMDRSVHGLEGAGEWHVLKEMLPDFSGKRVMDIGCGFGWHCRYAASHGALSVTGADISEKMLERARKMNSSPVITYIRCAAEDLECPDGSFDTVISSLALHYVGDFQAICHNAAHWLVPGGDFVFSVEHPVFTAQGPQDWYYGPGGKPAHWPVDNYFAQGERKAVFLGSEVVKYHRTVESYVGTLLGCGFVITGLAEPRPDPSMVESVPGMENELRRPMFLIISARKK